MRHLMIGAAIAAVLCASPVFAKDKTHSKVTGAGSTATVSKQDENRFRNDDGTFQGKPVVEGPAHWKDAGSASSGSSTGEGGTGAAEMK